MFKNKKNSNVALQAGQVSKLLLLLAVIVLVAMVITYLIVNMAQKPVKPVVPTAPVIPMPVYEQTMGNIRFVFESAIDKGNSLKVSDILNKQYLSSTQKDFPVSNPGAKFIMVTIGAQNVGKMNTSQGAWDIKNIVDSEGRNFVPVDTFGINSWFPSINLCGALLKPAFDPTPCVKIYEVSKESTGLKVTVVTGKNNTSQDISSGKGETALIDLIVK